MNPEILWDTRPMDLDRFLEALLLPDTTFGRDVQTGIDRITEILKERCFQDTGKSVRVTKVVKGRSSDQDPYLGTDLVVFLSNLQSYQDLIDRRGEFNEEIKKRLEECERGQEWMFKVKFEVNKSNDPQVLSFRMTSKQLSQKVDFYVVPAFDILGQVTPDFRPDPKVYLNLIMESRKGGEFSACFTELQSHFLTQRITKLISLIQLVKFWYEMCKKKMKSLPPQYALELLTVYAWEHGSQETHFSTARGFRTVLYLIEKYQELLVYWTVNYDSDDTIGDYLWSKLQKPRPVILDPADPTNDVGVGCWDKLAEEAQRWSSAPCFENQDGSFVKPWDVPVEQTYNGSKGFYLFSGSEMKDLVERASAYHNHLKLRADREDSCTLL
ncbi:2'-5'-oligoadenylate synthase 1-like [Macrotis lagotis]|uniref:2'-5'-oligoadenylate synthase 1-like n=1 Tax=Macrotis lagotis TaxID=92651 RepID=UPI003D69A23D